MSRKRKLLDAVTGAALLALIPAAVAIAGTSSGLSHKSAAGTPQLASDGHVEQVRQLAQCGSTMYAVGTFGRISSHGTIYGRANAFAFHATKPFGMTGWNPRVNGEVNSIAFGPKCAVAYLGGSFTRIGSAHVQNLAAVSTKTGRVLSGFRHAANKPVETVRHWGNHLIVGGYFTTINGTSRAELASLNPTTGKDDGFVNLHVSGYYHYHDFRGTASDPPRVYNQQVSHSGRYDLIEGVFTSVGGKARQQIAMLQLGGVKHATVTNWTSPLFFKRCASVESFYVRAAAWAPNDGSVYVGDTGYRYDLPNGARGGPPMQYLCDAAAAFPAAQKSVNARWINWTGCDSLYSVAASDTVVYFGGHERWSTNRYACDSPGRGHINAPGMEGLSAKTGRLVFNDPRARGLGADDMVLSRAGLWIASDTFGGGLCGGSTQRDGICLLPGG